MCRFENRSFKTKSFSKSDFENILTKKIEYVARIITKQIKRKVKEISGEKMISKICRVSV